MGKIFAFIFIIAFLIITGCGSMDNTPVYDIKYTLSVTFSNGETDTIQHDFCKVTNVKLEQENGDLRCVVWNKGQGVGSYETFISNIRYFNVIKIDTINK